MPSPSKLVNDTLQSILEGNNENGDKTQDSIWSKYELLVDLSSVSSLENSPDRRLKGNYNFSRIPNNSTMIKRNFLKPVDKFDVVHMYHRNLKQVKTKRLLVLEDGVMMWRKLCANQNTNKTIDLSEYQLLVNRKVNEIFLCKRIKVNGTRNTIQLYIQDNQNFESWVLAFKAHITYAKLWLLGGALVVQHEL